MVSVIFSVSITMYAISSFKKTYSLKYRVEFENLPEGIVVSDHSQTFIDVRVDCSYIVSGTSFFRENNKTVQVKLPENLSPLISFDMMNAEYNTPPFCSVISVSPRFITFEFERVVSRVVDVKPDIVGGVPDGYSYSIHVEPKKVVISGPESEIRGRNYVYTEMVDIQGRHETFSIEVPLSKIGNRVKIIPETVKVYVRIKRGGVKEKDGERESGERFSPDEQGDRKQTEEGEEANLNEK